MNILEQIQTAAKELGLPVPATAFDTADLTAIQLSGLWNALGQEQYEFYRWRELQATYVFDTVVNQESYELPADFSGMISNTVWSRTNHWSLIGAMTPQQWETLKSGIVALGPRRRYRLNGNAIEIFPTPTLEGTGASTDLETLAFEYYRSGWVVHPTGDTVEVRNDAISNDDTTFFPDRLMISGLKLKMWQIKGFDTRTLQADYERILGTVTSRNQAAPILSLSPRLSPIFIGLGNISDGNWNVGGSP